MRCFSEVIQRILVEFYIGDYLSPELNGQAVKEEITHTENYRV
jgi:hypothetical protein